MTTAASGAKAALADEPTPEAILIAAWKLRFNKAFRPEEEAVALMAFLDTVGLCVVSKRALADMRGAELERDTAVRQNDLLHKQLVAAEARAASARAFIDDLRNKVRDEALEEAAMVCEGRSQPGLARAISSLTPSPEEKTK